MPKLKRWLKEPLVHFLLLGAALFGVYQFTSKPGAGAPKVIVVTPARIETLAATFTHSRQRPPSPAELDNLIRDYVTEEVYCREAMALGLDRDDVIIRQRLRQKLELVPENLAAQLQPSEDDLRAYLCAHPDLFRVGRTFTFNQVFLDPERHRSTLEADAAKLRADLKQAGLQADLASFGDATYLWHTCRNLSGLQVAKQFGEAFAARLSQLPTGEWQGPVYSAQGAHLVFLSVRTEGRAPALAEVRDDVRREWAVAKRVEASEQFYQSLLRHYTVSIERPKAADPMALSAVKTR